MSQAAKQRSVVMSAGLAAAVQEGRKTTFRDPVRPQPINGLVWMMDGADRGQPNLWFVHGINGHPGAELHYTEAGQVPPVWTCPFGAPGDRLFVQEPWNKHGGAVTYLADGDWIADFNVDAVPPVRNRPKWEDADAMPEEYARLFLEIVSVKARRLQAIDAEQAKAEGVFYDAKARQYVIIEGDEFKGRSTRNAREAFYMLWESQRTGFMWASNPWVWVVEFKRIVP